LQIIDKEMERLKNERSKIESQLAAYQSKVDAVPVREQQLIELTRNYEVSKQLYNSLLEKTYGAGMAADLEEKQKAEHFTILDLARTPAEPFKPKRLRLFGVAAVASLLASLGLVILKEALNSTVKTEKELKDLIPDSVDLFAAIPSIEAPYDRRRSAWIAASAIVLSLLACLAVAEFLRKVHPIL